MWSRLPMHTGDRVVEIGSAPGGASQRLLDLGYEVTGIDAAEMDERVTANPRSNTGGTKLPQSSDGCIANSNGSFAMRT